MMGHFKWAITKKQYVFYIIILETNRCVDPTGIVGIENDSQFRVC